MIKPIVYLDLDGVLCRFVDAVCAILNRPYPSPWPKNVYSIADALGISEKEMWSKIDQHGFSFWANLEEYSYAKDLYKILCDRYKVYFCSTPSDNCESLKGKLLWLNKFTGTTCKNYVFTRNKFLLAKKGVILIDDFFKNIESFNEHNGQGILFPQKWNDNYFVEDKIEYIFCELDRISKINGHLSD